MPGLYTGASGLWGGFSGLLYGSTSLSTPPGLLADAAGFSPLSLFANGEQGVWYQNSDFSTLFQDAAGTTPVTGLEQPVGLRLDKSKGLVLGSELVTNGDFSGGSTGWALNSAPNSSQSVVSGRLRVTCVSPDLNARSSQPISTTIGVTYRISLISYWGTATLAPQLKIGTSQGGSQNATFNLVDGATFTGVFVATATTTFVTVQTNQASVYSEYDNISVRELPGSHASQSTAASRPVLSARYNQLVQTQDMSNAAWSKTGANATATVLTATSTNTVLANQSVTSALVTTWKYSAKVLKGTSFVLAISGNSSGAGAIFNGSTGAYVNATSTGLIWSLSAYSCVTHPDDSTYWLASVSVTNSSSDLNLVIPVIAINTTLGTTWRTGWGCDVGATLTATNHDLRVSNESSALPAYQRVGAATYGTSTSVGNPDYDTVGFPPYLLYDGGDWMVTPSINFGAGATNPPLGPELANVTSWTSVSGYQNVTVATGLTANRYYQIAFTCVSTNLGGLEIRVGDTSVGDVVINNVAAQAYLFTLQCDNSGQTQVRFYDTTGTAFEGTLTNISVKEVDPLYYPDKMSVFAGVRKLSDPGTAIIAELSASTGANAGAFVLMNYNTGWLWRSRGSVDITGAITINPAAPATNILTGTADIAGDVANLRVNALQAALDTGNQGTGNFGNYPLYLGARGGTSNWLTGRDYGFVIVGRGVNAAELTNTENYMDIQTFGRDMQLIYSDELTTATGDLITAADGDQIYMTVNYQ